MKYRVKVVVPFLQYATIEVEATDEADADRKATLAAENDKHVDWELGSAEFDELEVLKIEKVRPRR